MRWSGAGASQGAYRLPGQVISWMEIPQEQRIWSNLKKHLEAATAPSAVARRQAANHTADHMMRPGKSNAIQEAATSESSTTSGNAEQVDPVVPTGAALRERSRFGEDGRITGHHPRASVARMGFWSSSVALTGAIGYIVSVPLQILNAVSPAVDSVIAFISSLIIATPFLVAMLALHHIVPKEKSFWTHGAVLLAVVYTTYNTLNYVVQLATVLPAGYTWTFEDQQGTVGPLSLLNQTPHSLFWDVDGLGYIFLNLATLFAVPALEKRGAEGWVRLFFLVNGLITPLFAIAYFYPTFSVPILMLGGVPWAITVPGCLLSLTLFFRRESDPRSGPKTHQHAASPH